MSNSSFKAGLTRSLFHFHWVRIQSVCELWPPPLLQVDSVETEILCLGVSDWQRKLPNRRGRRWEEAVTDRASHHLRAASGVLWERLHSNRPITPGNRHEAWRVRVLLRRLWAGASWVRGGASGTCSRPRAQVMTPGVGGRPKKQCYWGGRQKRGSRAKVSWEVAEGVDVGTCRRNQRVSGV